MSIHIALSPLDRVFSPVTSDIILPCLSSSFLLHYTSCSRFLYQSDVLLLEGRRRYPAYFLLYDLSNKEGIKDKVPRISVHKLFAKALLMEKREKVDILMPRTQEDREKEIKEMWSDLPNQDDSKSMTFGKLVQRITCGAAIPLMQTVFRTFPYYSSLEMFLDLVFERFRVPLFGQSTFPELQGDEPTYTQAKRQIQLRTLNVLRKFSMEFGEYFLYIPDHGKLLTKFIKFIDEEVLSDPNLRIALFIKISLVKRALDDVTIQYQVPAFSMKITTEKLSAVTLADFDHCILAHELIMIDYEVFRNIKVPEMLMLGWQKVDKAARSPNVIALTTLFNQVQSEITAEPELSKRVKVMEKFIYMAEESAKSKGFQVTMAIMSGLNSAPACRLKQTNDSISKKARKVKNAMLDLVSPDRSYRSLRETTQNYDLPVLPYVGMTMTDLTFIEEGQGHRLPGIPIHKYQLISNVLNDIGMYQRVPFAFEMNASARSFLLQRLSLEYTQEQLFAASKKLEI